MRLRFEPFPESDDLLNAVADGSELLTLDLSDVQFVKPALLVGVAAIASAHRVRHGVPPQFVPPGLGDPRIYASRMSLGEVLSAEGVTQTGLDPVRHYDRHGQLCELRRFESNSEAVDLVNLVQQRCDTAEYPYEAAEALTLSIWELADNCLAHAQVGHGFLAAQVLPQPTRSLHFAVADGGIGIRDSLAGTPHERHDDQSAIRAAVESRVTSVASLHGRARGVGLSNLLEWVTATGGTLTIRSGGAAISFRRRAESAALELVPSTVDRVDGTLVSGWIPC
ncbi:hypothetical protein [Candidatus Poriferisodalis sp.]|uniref:hypothetical protein n=1 Tax=Candidatus Poriferisodalis sp. TaxID=3101277 RepID=UPI003B58EFD1